jgi:hypothetical protein
MHFRLFAQVKAVGAHRFFVTVSAASVDDPDRTGGVETGECATIEEANALRDRLVAELQARLRARGHHVADIRLE